MAGNISVYSNNETNMIDIPLWLQAPLGETALPYSVNALRYLSRGYRASAPSGVGSGTDFVVSAGSGFTIHISAGLGVMFHTDNVQERYALGTFGNVDIDLSTLTRGTTGSPTYHLVTAQALDPQIPGLTVGVGRWRFLVIDNVGSSVTPGAASIALAKIKDTGGSIVATDITDLREPFDNTSPTCAITRVTSTSIPNDGLRHNIDFTAQEDDPWNLWVSTVPQKISVRHPGTYNIMLRADFPSVVDSAHYATLIVGVNGLATPIVYNSLAGSSQGTTVTAVLLNEKIIPTAGYFLQCGAAQTAASASISNVKFRLQRVEYRAS